MSPLIRNASKNELAGIRAMDRLVLGSDKRKTFLEEAVKQGRCLVAVTNDTLAGFAVSGHSFYEQWFIELLIVHPDFRRSGIATALLQRIESACTGEKLFTSTNQSNTVAQAVYEKNGFVKSGFIDNLDEGDPEIVYYKRVQ